MFDSCGYIELFQYVSYIIMIDKNSNKTLLNMCSILMVHYRATPQEGKLVLCLYALLFK